MAGERVFVDTTALLALVNSDDALHARAAAAYRELTRTRAELHSTEWVLAEFLNGVSRPQTRGAGVQLVSALRGSARTTIVPASHESWLEAFAFYAARPDKDWSFVDCGSILACESRGISKVLTYDHHFTQAGLEAMLR